MKSHKPAIAILFCLINSLLAGVAFAQENSYSKVEKDLMYSWVVTIKGQESPTVFKVHSIKQKDDKSFVLEATYRFLNTKEVPADAELLLIGDERKLVFTTQSGEKVTAIQVREKVFEGTYTNLKGEAVEVALKKTPWPEIQALQDAYKKNRGSQVATPETVVTEKVIVDVPVACVSSVDQCIQKPDVKIGDRWVYKVTNNFNDEEMSRFEQKITDVGEDKIKLDQATISSTSEASVGRVQKRQADRSTWTFPNSRIFEGRYVFLAFPLEVGKTWKNEYKINRSDGGTTSYNSPVTVEGWEDVQVPAGKFKAIKIVHSGFYSAQKINSSWTGSTAETFWYAPEVKKFVKSEFIDTPGGNRVRTELVEYEVK